MLTDQSVMYQADGMAFARALEHEDNRALRPSVMRPSTRRPGTAIALEGRYANYFEVMHGPCEFIVDFGQYHPEQGAAQLHLRVVTGPVYAKLLASMLIDAIERHERQHGVIHTELVGSGTAFDIGDRGPVTRTDEGNRRG